jgi:hypothetical protein
MLSIENFIKIFEPHELLFKDEEELRQYVWEKGKILTKLVKDNFKKFSTGYTIFLPVESFEKGEWADFSPSFFVGLEEEEVKKGILSTCLYYLWPEGVPFPSQARQVIIVHSFTELWLMRISADYPYSIQMIRNNGKNEFSIDMNSNIGLITIYFPFKIWKQLDNFLNKFYASVVGCTIEGIEKQIKVKVDDNITEYDFRKVGRVIEHVIDANEIMGKINEEYEKNDIEKIICSLSKALKNILNNVDDSEIRKLAVVFIKLLLIGPRCSTALRILCPKQFLIKNKHIGNFAEILRIYDECGEELERKLEEIYPLAYAAVDNLGFHIVSHYIEKFRQFYAIRSAIAAIMARNMSHNIGSHVLSHFIADVEGNISQPRKELLDYLKARMDFIAEISTYWRELPWLNQ